MRRSPWRRRRPVSRETVREVAQLFVQERRDAALVDAEQTQLSQANEDLARDNSLKSVHGVSLETLEHDENAVRSARAALQQAQASLASTQAEIAGTTPATHPRVLQAEANLRASWLELTRTHVLAPVSGYVVRRSVELGAQVAPSTEMLALVPVGSMWIDANFKENQLGSLRIDQPVKVTVDMYGSHVDYHGKVLGLTAGTGSALAVLPTRERHRQLDQDRAAPAGPHRSGSGELARHPLFLGLSANINVDVTDLGGSALSQMPAWPATQRTDVYGNQDSGADRMIDAIISANLGGSDETLYARSAGGSRR